MVEIRTSKKSQTEFNFQHPVVNVIDDRFSRYSTDRASYEKDWRNDYDSWMRIYTEKWKQAEGVDWRSNVFIGLTDMKVRLAVAAINEVLLAGGQFPFNITPTPEFQTLGDLLEMNPQEIEQRTSRMREKVKDQLVEMKADRALKSAVTEFVVYGTTITKCPLMLPYRKRRYVLQAQGWDLDVFWAERIGFKHINLWDFFIDQEAETPQDGEGCIHRVKMSTGEFHRLVRLSGGWIKAGVKAVLEEITDVSGTYSEGATKGNEGPGRDKVSERKKPIEVREYWGVLDRRELEEMGSEAEIITRQFSKDQLREYEELEVSVTVANDYLVKVIANPHDGFRPFQIGKYDSVPHEPWGRGIPWKMRDAQAMVNSGVRAYVDNMALSANVQGIFNPRALAPGQDATIHPGKIWEATEAFQGDMQNAFRQIVVENVGLKLLPMIELFERYASEQTLPNLLGGQTEQNQPDTAYGMSRLWEGAYKSLSEPIRNLDEGLIEPIIEAFYHYNMADPDLSEAYKGDMEIQATGFSSFNDKNLRGERLRALLAMALGSEVLLQATKVLPLYRDIVKTMDEDPDTYIYTEEEMLQKMRDMQAQIQAVAGAVPEMMAPAGEGPGEMIPNAA